jgi:hypothetical protein
LVNALPRFVDGNWLSEIVKCGLGDGLLRYLGRGEVVRGVDMYGLDFFFLLIGIGVSWVGIGGYVIIRSSDGQRLGYA